MLDHNGKAVSPDRFKAACEQLANERIRSAYAIRHGDSYASHVVESRKDAILRQNLLHAESIREGVVDSFATWQALNYILTGESVPFLPKVVNNG